MRNTLAMRNQALDTSSEDDDELEDEESNSDQNDVSDDSDEEVLQVSGKSAPSSPKKSKGKAPAGQNESNLIVQTAFDAYFTYAASRPQTSSNVFSQLVLPLTAEEYTQAITSASERVKSTRSILVSDDEFRAHLFSRFLFELKEGFNILCYGFGSKRQLLNQFATEFCSKSGHVVIANAFQPDFSLKQMLNSIENVPGILEVDLSSTTTEKQTRRIYDFFSRPSTKLHLFLVIHNIDASPLRSAKAKSILSLFALNPRIHIIASVDHINSPLLWSSSETSARKSTLATSNSITDEPVAPRGFSWLWHDLTTLSPYDFELAYADKSSISGAHGGGARRKADTLTAQNATAMGETAALHILASVTQKAQKLFALLGNKQLETIEESGEGSAANDPQQFAMLYESLFAAARENFIATNDTSLRSLLGEFRDHRLVISAQASSGSGEMLWIPMRKERLLNVLNQLKVEE